LNRTKVGLKLDEKDSTLQVVNSLNRTKVGLKQECSARCADTIRRLNRTKVGLKRDNTGGIGIAAAVV